MQPGSPLPLLVCGLMQGHSKQHDQLASSSPANRSRQLVQTPSKQTAEHHPYSSTTADGTSNSSSIAGQLHDHNDDPRLQQLVQRLVADQVAEHKMQSRQLPKW